MTDGSKSLPVQAASEPELAARAGNWSRHWAAGSTHSCAGSFGETYEGAIAAFWCSIFDALPVNARVLDIATGGGALPHLLTQRLAQRRDWRCDAVDLAEIKPTWVDGLAPDLAHGVHFHAAVPAEKLPFRAATFDLVVSQYGLEYTDLYRSVAEVRRVTREGGRVALVLHHARSRPVELAALEIAHIDWLLAPAGPMHTTDAMLEPLSRTSTPQGLASLQGDAAADAVREAFNASQDALSERARMSPDGADVLLETRDHIARVVQLAMSEGLSASARHLQAYERALIDARWRLTELRRFALNESDLSRLTAMLSAMGSVETRPISERGHLMGWALSTRS